MNPSVSLQAVSKRFGSTAAVQGCTFDVPAGSITVLLGANGSGKTTILRLVMGLIVPDAGSVEVAGCPPDGSSRSAIGYVPATTDIPYEWMRGSDVITFFRSYFPTWNEAWHLRAMDCLGVNFDRLYTDLSQGQRRRLQLICALSHSASLIVLDEPFAAIDPQARAVTRSLLRSYVASFPGAAVLFTSHDRDDVVDLADRAAVLVNGSVTTTVSFHDQEPGRTAAAASFVQSWFAP